MMKRIAENSSKKVINKRDRFTHTHTHTLSLSLSLSLSRMAFLFFPYNHNSFFNNYKIFFYKFNYFISIPPSLKKRGGGRFYKVQNANCKMKELKTKFPF